MKQQIIAVFGLSALTIFASCGSSSSDTSSQTITTSNGMTVDTTIPMPSANEIAPAPGTTTMPTAQGETIVPQTSTQPSTSNATARLNPPHGEPGHDCAIPVGAPLNSSTTTAPAPATLSTPAVAPANTNAKVNPPHGQPGHDCAIPVGAPLKS